VLNLSKDEDEIAPYQAKVSDAIASFICVERTTMIKEPTVPDIEWHGRLFAIAGVMFYSSSATYPL
jgi:hypothetical protein